MQTCVRHRKSFLFLPSGVAFRSWHHERTCSHPRSLLLVEHGERHVNDAQILLLVAGAYISHLVVQRALL